MAAKNGRTTIKIDPEVLRQAKLDAERDGLTLSGFIERKLRRARKSEGAPPREVNLPSFNLGESLLDLSPAGIKELFARDEIEKLHRIEAEAREPEGGR